MLCASSGNFGQAIAYAGRTRGLRVDVFAPDHVNPQKRARMEMLGAHVSLAGPDSSEVRKAATAFAEEHTDVVYVMDGREPAVAEGAGTIGVELSREKDFDTIVLPVGDGALITGVARWMRAHAPRTKIIGVNAAGAPAMHNSLRGGRPITLDHIDTIADGMAVRAPLEESLARVTELVDDIVLVNDAALLDAIEVTANALGILLEPAGAAGIAAVMHDLVPGQRVATVLTGANPRPEIRHATDRLAGPSSRPIGARAGDGGTVPRLVGRAYATPGPRT